MRRLVALLVLVSCCVPLTPSAQMQMVEEFCLSSAHPLVPAGGWITVDATAGGVQVLAANPRRCNATIINHGAAEMTCGAVGVATPVTLTATTGIPVAAGASLGLKLGESRFQWNCLRTTGTSTQASVTESAVP